jgi:hypothetical protein
VLGDPGRMDVAIAARPVRTTEPRISEAYPSAYNDDDGCKHGGDAGGLTK